MNSSTSYPYDVFVSFRGEDETHRSFIHQFCSFLSHRRIRACTNDTFDHDFISPEVVRAIESCHIFIVVFSKNYASSALCLTELEKILECAQSYGKRALPVFYDVDPSEVIHFKGSYAEAFAQHENEFGHDSEKVRRWREAVTQVANLSGWDLRDKLGSYEEIYNIVEWISNKVDLIRKLPNYLVGIDSPIEELEECLLLDSVDDVRTVGIRGMAGIGKTNLAIVLYNKISKQFDVCCFLVDVSKIYEQYGPIGVLKEILHQTLAEEFNLCQLRALIILDNVGHSEQLENLAVNLKLLAPGSRIVIICKETHILKEYGVDAIYEVPLLNETYSLQLFHRSAFKHDNFISNYDDYEELTCDMLKYANGLPLVINVLGRSLYAQSISEWRSVFDKLGEIHMDALQFSLNGIEKKEKEIFLHIACFFNHCEEDYVKNVLNCCGFDADSGFIVLIEKSVISISNESKIEMHALLEALGRTIVHEDLIMESKWSKLWLHEQFYNVASEHMENEVDAVVLYGPERENGNLMAEKLSRMNNLRLLILKEVKFSGILHYLSNKLIYAEWHEYPFSQLPFNFEPDLLVELILVDSNIEQFYFATEYLPYLRTLDLSYSENLTKMPYFGGFKNLKRLNLEGCVRLMKIDSSIGLLRKLVFLNLKNCENLICIPNEISRLTSLKYLNLSSCSKAFNNPKAHEDFSSCVFPSFANFSSLSELDISFCSLSQIPDALGCITWLERLNLRGNKIVTLPSLRDLSKLEYLNLEHCKQLTSLPELPSPAAVKQDKHKKVGMYIFNCPELGEREHCTSRTFSWMTNLIHANQDSSASFQQIDIVIPGSQIPRLFNNRRTGGSISIDPSSIVYDNNIIGIACCVVFSAEPFDPTKKGYEWGPVIRLGFKSSNAANSNYVVIPVTLYRYLITVKSNHMWLVYFDRELFFSFLRSIEDNTLWELDHIVMEASVMNGQGLHMEVKSCGYSWVFKQDQQPFES